MLGQPASWQTVCRPSRCTRPRSAVNSGPIRAFTLIQGGLRSIGVCELRASMRSRRRPSGVAAVIVDGAECSVVTVLHTTPGTGKNGQLTRAGRRGSRLTGSGCYRAAHHVRGGREDEACGAVNLKRTAIYQLSGAGSPRFHTPTPPIVAEPDGRLARRQRGNTPAW